MPRGFAHTTLFIAVGSILLLGGLGALLLYRGGSEMTTVPVTRGTITEEVSANGTVEPPSTIDLRFAQTGTLSEVPIAAGDPITRGALLARQSDAALLAQLAEYQAQIAIEQARLAQLLAGTPPAEVAVSRAAFINAQDTLRDAIESAFPLADDAVRKYADRLFNHPETDPSFGIEFQSGNTTYNLKAASQTDRAAINTARRAIETILDTWPTAAILANDSLSEAAQEVEADLRTISDMLDRIAAVINAKIANSATEAAVYEDFKADIATARSNLSTALTSVVTARTTLLSADASLAAATAPVRDADIAVAKAQVAQAQAGYARADATLSKLSLYAPTDGTVAKVNAEVGETIGPESVIISLIPENSLQITLNVSENVVANVAVGQHARITLDAFTGTEWQGMVTSVEPAETLVGGAVYYETVVTFTDPDPRIRPGMTATVWIETAANNDARMVPASALIQQDGEVMVRVLENGEPVERKVTTGIMDAEGMVEIVSGLEEGEEVILSLPE